MLFMSKILDAFKLESTREMEKEMSVSERKQEKSSNAYNKYSEQEEIKSILKAKRKHMSQYDIEQFAKECNAYMIREERKERQEKEFGEREEKRRR